MDPLSILGAVSGALQIADATAKILKWFYQTFQKLANAAEHIQHYQHRIGHLMLELRSIHDVMKKRESGSRLPFEQPHLERIASIVKSCDLSLERLRVNMEQIQTNCPKSSRFRRLFEDTAQSWKLFLDNETINNDFTNIKHYTDVLHISISTLNWVNTSDIRESQLEMSEQIQELNRKIDTVLSTPSQDINQSRSHGPRVDDGTGVDSFVYQEIKAWKTSARVVIASLTMPPVLDARQQQKSDAQPSEVTKRTQHSLTSRLRPYKYDVILQLVNYFEKDQQYEYAIPQLREAIGIREEWDETPAGTIQESVTDMKERLASMLTRHGTDESIEEAIGILKDILRNGTPTDEDSRSTADLRYRSRIEHELGKLFHSKNLSDAVDMLETALNHRLNISPREGDIKDEIFATFNLLQEVYVKNGDITGHTALRKLIQNEVGGITGRTYSQNTAVVRWCKHNGFELKEEESPRFDVRNSDGFFPLHVAARDINMNPVLLEEMLRSSAMETLEMKDASGNTPLLIAIDASNAKLVDVLLRSGAQISATDSDGRTVFHKCRNAGMITHLTEQPARKLSTWTIPASPTEAVPSPNPNLEVNVNTSDNYNKSPLHHACEKADLNLVRALLSVDADPNQLGPGGRSPLIIAIESRTHTQPPIRVVPKIVELLLEHGAEPHRKDKGGRTAFDAAGNAGVAKNAVKKLLKAASPKLAGQTESAPRRPSAQSRYTRSASIGELDRYNSSKAAPSFAELETITTSETSGTSSSSRAEL